VEDVATVKPAGRVSVKLMPVKAVAEFGLLMEKVSVVVFPVKIGLAVKDLLIEGGAITVRVDVPNPVPVVLGPVSAEVIGLLTFVYCPATLPNTLTEIVQFALAESVPPLTLIERVPDTAVVVAPVNVPAVQEVASPLGVAITKPTGRVSVKPTPVKADPLGLVKANRRVLVPPCAIGEVRKLFERVGTTGRGHPLMVILSRRTEAVAWFPLVAAVMRNQVVLAPVVAAVPVAAGCHEPFVAGVVLTSEKLVPSVLE
jgi:hypothetical protein